MEALLATFELEHAIHSLHDLRNGTTLFEFPQIVYAAPSLSTVVFVSLPACSDAEYLRLQSRAALRTGICNSRPSQYLSDILHQQTTSLVVSDLQAMA